MFIRQLIVFGVLALIVALGYLFIRRFRTKLQKRLVRSRIAEGWELVYPETVLPVRDRLGVDVDGRTAREAYRRLDERGIDAERVGEVLESTIDRLVEDPTDYDSPETVLPALWVTLGFLHHASLDDPRRALDCFDISDALAAGDEWAFIDSETALDSVREEVEFDDDVERGSPPSGDSHAPAPWFEPGSGGDGP